MQKSLDDVTKNVKNKMTKICSHRRFPVLAYLSVSSSFIFPAAIPLEQQTISYLISQTPAKQTSMS